MSQRPNGLEIVGLAVVTYLASLAHGPLGELVARPLASPLGQLALSAAYLGSGLLLCGGALALAALPWRWRAGLLAGPAVEDDRAVGVAAPPAEAMPVEPDEADPFEDDLVDPLGQTFADEAMHDGDPEWGASPDDGIDAPDDEAPGW